ncbi:MAG: hypothetical protein WC810_26695 [Janthinobacterium sp.]|jgi:hypothetical protein
MTGKLLHFPGKTTPKDVPKPTDDRSKTHICAYHQEKFKLTGQWDQRPLDMLCRIILCKNQGVFIPDPKSDKERWPFIKKTK